MTFQNTLIRKSIYVLLSILLFACGETSKPKTLPSLEIEWVENLKGDFSFKNNWSYPEGIDRNEFGQVTCNGICPPEIATMINENGAIIEDSINSFYKLVDTSHQYHTLKSNAWCYEWNGSDFISVKKTNKQEFSCYTLMNTSTHCSLKMRMVNNSCFPFIELKSAANNELKIYECKNGIIKIDKQKWEKDTMKAEFSFHFEHKENAEKPMFWEGKIYAPISKIVE